MANSSTACGMLDFAPVSSRADENTASSSTDFVHTDEKYLNDLASRAENETDFDSGRGDIKLIVKREDIGESGLEVFRASSTAMIRACRPWERMLAGPFAEAQSNHPKILDYTEEGYASVKIVMDIIHLRFSEVPSTLALRTLTELAIFSDKYMLTAIMAPWVKGWVEPLYPTIETEGNEHSWLWISWECGLINIFQSLLHRLCMDASTTGDLLEEPQHVFSSELDHLIRGKDESRKECIDDVLPGRISHCALGVGTCLPPGVEDSVTVKRHAMVAKTLEVIYEYASKLSLAAHNRVLPNTEKSVSEDRKDIASLCSDQKYDCIILQLGSLMCALDSQGLWPKKDPDDIHMSPSQLYKLLSSIRLSGCQDNDLSNSHSHHRSTRKSTRSTCGPFAGIIKQILELSSRSNGLSSAQITHLMKQSAKLPVFSRPADSYQNRNAISRFGI